MSATIATLLSLWLAGVPAVTEPGPVLETLIEGTCDSEPGIVSRFMLARDAQGDLAYLLFVPEPGKPAVKITSEQLARHETIVLLRHKPSGREVLLLEGEGPVNSKDGGRLRLYYLHNGLTGSFQHFSFELVREGVRWTAYVSHRGVRDTDSPFQNIFLKSRTWFKQEIGIDYITPR